MHVGFSLCFVCYCTTKNALTSRHNLQLPAYIVWTSIKEGECDVAYQGSKGWYIQKLKELGVRYHPVDRRKLELYKAYVLRNLYLEMTEKKTK